MSDRSDRVVLSPAEPRCAPSGRCVLLARCARAQATIPKGTPLADYTIGSLMRGAFGGTVYCPGFIDVASVHAAAPAQREPKPAVKGII